MGKLSLDSLLLQLLQKFDKGEISISTPISGERHVFIYLPGAKEINIIHDMRAKKIVKFKTYLLKEEEIEEKSYKDSIHDFWMV